MDILRASAVFFFPPLLWLPLTSFYWRRQRHPTPVLLPGKSHGRRSLVGCSPWGGEESDTTERLHFHVLEKETATHSSVLAWRIPGTGEPGGLLSMGSHRVGHDWSDLVAATSFYTEKSHWLVLSQPLVHLNSAWTAYDTPLQVSAHDMEKLQPQLKKQLEELAQLHETIKNCDSYFLELFTSVRCI